MSSTRVRCEKIDRVWSKTELIRGVFSLVSVFVRAASLLSSCLKIKMAALDGERLDGGELELVRQIKRRDVDRCVRMNTPPQQLKGRGGERDHKTMTDKIRFVINVLVMSIWELYA